MIPAMIRDLRERSEGKSPLRRDIQRRDVEPLRVKPPISISTGFLGGELPTVRIETLVVVSITMIR